MNENQKCRPVTGKLLIGGDFYKHVGYGVDKSWLSTENPEKYLFSAENFSADNGSFGSRFALPAMQETLSSILFDLPMHRESENMKGSQNITVLFLPEGKPWKEAFCICEIPWKDIDIVENGNREWRRWDRKWFISLVASSVAESKKDANDAKKKAEEAAEIYSTMKSLLEEIQSNK